MHEMHSPFKGFRDISYYFIFKIITIEGNYSVINYPEKMNGDEIIL